MQFPAETINNFSENNSYKFQNFHWDKIEIQGQKSYKSKMKFSEGKKLNKG